MERFSTLMRPTGHTSDTFKFHLRKLINLGYVAKLKDGWYVLTPKGKEFANSLNEGLRTTEKQPKISVLVVVPRQTPKGERQYLVQRRARNPFYGYWSEVHGRATWGESFEETAQRQLKRQTGLEALCTIHSFRRTRDYEATGGQLLEDKLFVVVKATQIAGELTNTYSGGTNAWMSLEELRAQDKVFISTIDIIESIEGISFYHTQDFIYSGEEY